MKTDSKNERTNPRQRISGNPKQDNTTYDFTQIEQITSSAKDISALQRTIGNQATMQMLQQSQPKSTHSGERAIALLPSDLNDAIEGSTHNTPQDGLTIQRLMKALPGKSSGWFRKGRRDKINSMVDAYNDREIALSGAKRTAANYEMLLPDIQKIWDAANAWHISVAKKSALKAQEIRDWMTAEVERERTAKTVQIGELAEAESMKAAYDGAAYNPLYAGPEYSSAEAGVLWLNTPALNPIYRYHILQKQFDGPSLKAYDDVMKYKTNPSRAEALKLYDEYTMDNTRTLNISGEGRNVGGTAAMVEFRAQFAALRADASAAPPATFGPVERSLINIMNEIFISFKGTPPHKKVVTPPPAG